MRNKKPIFTKEKTTELSLQKPKKVSVVTALRAYHKANRIHNDFEAELYDLGEKALRNVR